MAPRRKADPPARVSPPRSRRGSGILIALGALLLLGVLVFVLLSKDEDGSPVADAGPRVIAYQTGGLTNPPEDYEQLNRSVLETGGALVQAITATNALLFLDPAQTSYDTFRTRLRQAQQSLETLERQAAETEQVVDRFREPTGVGAPPGAGVLLASSLPLFQVKGKDRSAQAVLATLKTGKINRPIKTLMEAYQVDAKRAQLILNNAMAGLESEAYAEEAQTHDRLEKAATVIKEGSSLAVTIGTTFTPIGAVGTAFTAASRLEKGMAIIENADAAVKFTKAGAELLLGEKNKFSEFAEKSVLVKGLSEAAQVVAIVDLTKVLTGKAGAAGGELAEREADAARRFANSEREAARAQRGAADEMAQLAANAQREARNAEATARNAETSARAARAELAARKAERDAAYAARGQTDAARQAAERERELAEASVRRAESELAAAEAKIAEGLTAGQEARRRLAAAEPDARRASELAEKAEELAAAAQAKLARHQAELNAWKRGDETSARGEAWQSIQFLSDLALDPEGITSLKLGSTAGVLVGKYEASFVEDMQKLGKPLLHDPIPPEKQLPPGRYIIPGVAGSTLKLQGAGLDPSLAGQIAILPEGEVVAAPQREVKLSPGARRELDDFERLLARAQQEAQLQAAREELDLALAMAAAEVAALPQAYDGSWSGYNPITGIPGTGSENASGAIRFRLDPDAGAFTCEADGSIEQSAELKVEGYAAFVHASGTISATSCSGSFDPVSGELSGRMEWTASGSFTVRIPELPQFQHSETLSDTAGAAIKGTLERSSGSGTFVIEGDSYQWTATPN